jgi:hypothetical protein
LTKLPPEQILPHLIEQEVGDADQPIDNRGNDRVSARSVSNAGQVTAQTDQSITAQSN